MLQKATIDEIYNLLYSSEATLNNGYATTLYTLKDFNTINNEIVYNDKYINIFSWIDFLKYIERKYATFSYLFAIPPLAPLTDAQKVMHFHEDFTEFYNKNQNNLQHKYEALFCTYSPIENTSAFVTTTTTDSGSETNTQSEAGTEANTRREGGSETNTNVKTGNTSFGKGTTQTDTYQVSADNTNTFLDDTKNTSVNTGTDTETYNNITDTNTRSFNQRETTDTKSFKDRETTNVKSFEDRINEVIEHRHGNIGVTTNTQMINEILKTYTKIFQYDFFDEFIKEYCFLI